MLTERVIILGAGGQLGRELVAQAPEAVELFPFGSSDLDITSNVQVEACFAELRPSLVINAAAYTQVDNAEENFSEAFAVNSDGPANLGRLLPPESRIIHVSTDFVFDGKARQPYLPSAQTAPLSNYGRSKLAGEQHLRRLCPGRFLIVRTAWLYAADGRNFMNTMLKLMAEREEISVVADQVGTPTAVPGLADALWRFSRYPALSGIYHWTDQGQASWHEFASEIQKQAVTLGLLEQSIPIIPITTAEYPTPAQRPAYSVLDKRSSYEALNWQGQHWREALAEVLQAVCSQQEPGGAPLST